MHRIDGEGATVDNKFTEGNPSTGTPATTVTADFMNALQEEIIAVLAEAGISPLKTDNTQLRAAILSLIAGGGFAVSAGGVSIADVGGYYSGTDVEAALQQVAAKLYAGTLNANQIRRTVITPAAGAAFTLDATHLENVLELTNATDITYTIPNSATYDAPIGSTVTIAQAGAGKVIFSPAGGVTLKKPGVFLAKTIGQDGTAVLYKVSANTWRLGGMLEAA